jgi:hypothetical protein
MMFSEIHSTCALYLIAIALAGVLMLMCRTNKEVKCAGCQVISYFILILALLGLLFTGYYKICCWKQLNMGTSCPVVKAQMLDKILYDGNKQQPTR